MVTHALVNLPDTDMALPMVMQCAKIVLAHVNVHSVNAMLNSLVSMLVKPEFLMRNITCKRALCECDAKFAREHVGQTGVFDEKYHMFWSTNNGGTMWDPANDDT